MQCGDSLSHGPQNVPVQMQVKDLVTLSGTITTATVV